MITPAESQILQGDARVLLDELPADFFRMCVTAPPYWTPSVVVKEDGVGTEATLDAWLADLVSVARKIRRTLTPDGTFWLVVADTYMPSSQIGLPARRLPDPPKGLKPAELIGISWQAAFALQADGWYLHSEIIWEKPNAGRERSIGRPRRSHEHIFLMSRSERYLYNTEALDEHSFGGRTSQRTVWSVATEPVPGIDYATFPVALVEPCILAGSHPYDFVLDPFFGAGTVGLAAAQVGRRYLGIELDPRYVELARQRIAIRS
jgi:site-specific DNA-methyltransferase (cytosine-N4-specific)